MIIENYLGWGGFGFVLRRNELDSDDFAISEFEFETEAEAREYFELQVPHMETGQRRSGAKFDPA